MKRPRIDRYSAVMLCLLAGLYVVVGVEWLRRGGPASIVQPRLTATGTAWERSHLRDRIANVRLRDVPLETAISQLRSQTGAMIDVDWQALQSTGVQRSCKVSASLTDVELSTALRVILNATNRDLEFGVLNGGTIVIRVDPLPSLVVYDIRGLIPSPPAPSGSPPLFVTSRGATFGAGIGAAGGGAGLFSNAPMPPPMAAPSPAEDAFAETISSFLQGPASTSGDAKPRARVDVWAHRLIVTGSPEVQREVEDMLRKVRETDRK